MGKWLLRLKPAAFPALDVRPAYLPFVVFFQGVFGSGLGIAAVQRRFSVRAS
jgi:hypothetical protein